MNIHRRFRELNPAAADMSSPVFLGLCAYLHVLLSWRWPIPAEQFDNFICAYQAYQKHPSYRQVSYHAWFWSNPQPTPRPPILEADTLDAIAAENPYTFGFVNESMCAIARHRGLDPADATRAALGPPRTDIQPAQDRIPGTPPHPDPQHAAPNTGTPTQPIRAAQFQPLDLDELGDPYIWHNEKALRKSLGVRDRDELFKWMQQDWVFEVYEEYCVAVLDQWLLERCVPALPASRGSSAKFIINSSARALQLQDTHHLQDRDRTRWTQDEHDVRFIVRLVDEGRRYGR
jgi:hypothetical protein